MSDELNSKLVELLEDERSVSGRDTGRAGETRLNGGQSS